MKYKDKIAARRLDAQIDLAVRITDGLAAPPPPPSPPKPKPAPTVPRGVLVDLGTMPENCAAALDEAADALDRAAEIARAMLARAARSVQSGESSGAAIFAETIAPRIRAAATRLRRMPAKPKQP